MPASTFGLIGSITRDAISLDSGKSHTGLGGILYQTAALSGLGGDVLLCCHLGSDVASEALAVIQGWPNVRREGIIRVSGPGNRVRLHYPPEGERTEVLDSIVPPLRADAILPLLAEMDFLVLIMNSGFDIEIQDWKRVLRRVSCPVWLDIHSLVLERKVGSLRHYTSFDTWKDWVEGIDYIQANRKEVACMLGHPDSECTEEDLSMFAKKVIDLGAKAVFITLGSQGARVTAPSGSWDVRAEIVADVVDTTGCGDVFCAAAVKRLAEGKSLDEAACFGVEWATKAAGAAGVNETYFLFLT